MLGHVALVQDAELEPVVRHFLQGAGDGRIALAFNGLTHLHELVPGRIGAGDLQAAVGQNGFVHEHAFPISAGRNGVGLGVHKGKGHGRIQHVGCIVRVFLADLLDGHDLAVLDKLAGVSTREEEEHVRFASGLEVGFDLGLPLLV